MGMTVDKAIEIVESAKNFSYDAEYDNAFDVAINTMHKYQKIREIAFPLQFCSTDKLEHEAIMKICEVLEDGSENNHNASNT